MFIVYMDCAPAIDSFPTTDQIVAVASKQLTVKYKQSDCINAPT